ncbi:aspartate-alanine antiporter [Janthinobacterium sp. PLB04]|uniref:Aspartate-alanine antiporter n=1 Tax=Janthinobacterium lividum TaxID=29581 RepID=A0AAJ4T7B6_9BURK|nr:MULTISPECIES: aspartate-alanine antiporter [Janthinobacterium]KAB0324394.1 aspartate-alanine antiporter [Janthinobacterium lividum]QSX98494.1 aspartate-alanine antiporter [Janthinobacterium lividum]UGQ38453.1 aspartate-alanine antiporter [Janthinobacterium sp. PLB04]
MLDSITSILHQVPELALFLALGLGYAVGQIRFGPIQLGGVCGTLIAALLIGQLGITLDASVKNVFFMLFIFALGYAGGPQFFANLNAKGLRLGLLCLIEVVVVLALVLLATRFLGLDQGTAAGMMAGAATESAVVGTATDAISKLALPAARIAELQANVVTAYSITYIFGLIAIVIVTSQIFPLLLRVNLREEADKLWEKMGGAQTDGDGVQATPEMVGRAYRISRGAGRRLDALQHIFAGRASITRVRRHGKVLPLEPELRLRNNDEVLVIGHRPALVAAEAILGEEFADTTGLNMAVSAVEVVLQQASLVGQPLRQLALPSGVHVAAVVRGEHSMPPLPDLSLQRDDVLRLYGTTEGRELNTALAAIGKRVPTGDRSNIVYASIGIVLGVYIGGFSAKLGGIPFSLGTGGGALLTGLVFGWYQARKPGMQGIPPSALDMMKDIGLATFIACVGLASGPQAIDLIRQYGLSLPLMGVLIAVIPASLSLLVGHFFLKLEAPVLLGAIAGQQCSTPALSAVQNAAGNSTPLLGYTITYAISNVVLPLLGPLIVALAGSVHA